MKFANFKLIQEPTLYKNGLIIATYQHFIRFYKISMKGRAKELIYEYNKTTKMTVRRGASYQYDIDYKSEIKKFMEGAQNGTN